jgi:hypothetical protein
MLFCKIYKTMREKEEREGEREGGEGGWQSVDGRKP